MPGLWLLPAAVVFTVTATGEAIALARQAGMAPPAGDRSCGQSPAGAGPLGARALPTLPLLPAFAGLWGGSPWAGGTLALWIVAAAVILVFLDQMRRYRKPGGITANLSAAAFVMVYVGVMLSFAVQLRTRLGPRRAGLVADHGQGGRHRRLSPLGRTLGRHKIAPVAEPKQDDRRGHRGPGLLLPGIVGDVHLARAGASRRGTCRAGRAGVGSPSACCWAGRA